MMGDLEDKNGMRIFRENGGFWFFAGVIIFFVLVFVMDGVWVREQMMLEAKGLGVWVGGDGAIDVFNRAVAWYKYLVTENQLEQKLALFVLPGEPTGGSDSAVRDATLFIWRGAEEWLGNFWVMVFQAFYRVSLLLYWLLFMLPVMVVSFIDGYYERAIRRQQFGWSSVNIFRMGAYFVYVAPLFVSFYLMLPVMPIMGHLLPVFYFLLFALGTRMMASNFMRYL